MKIVSTLVVLALIATFAYAQTQVSLIMMPINVFTMKIFTSIIKFKFFNTDQSFVKYLLCPP